MTTLVSDIGHDPYFPSLDSRSYIVLGEAMGLVTERVIQARSHLTDSLRCSFWNGVMEARNPSLFDQDKVHAVTVDPAAVRLAADYSLCASKLEPTRLLDFEQ